MDLQDAVDQLYGGAPEGFIALRAALAKQARESGDRKLAAKIAALRRPTVSAWLINMESRGNPSLISQLGKLGDKLRRAQERLDGQAIRRLDLERKALLSKAMSALAKQAQAQDHALSDSVRSELERTLSAAVLDPDSARLVEAGAVASALSQVGFGSTPTFGRPGSQAGGRPSRPPLRAVPDLPDLPEAPRRAGEQHEAALMRAERATRALDEAQEATAKAQEREEAIRARIDELRQDLAAAADEVRAAKDAQRRASRDEAAAMRRLERR